MLQQTSLDAHESAKVQPLREQIHALVRDRGALGATDWEMQQALHRPSHSQVPRRNELCADGYVKDSGMRRRTPTGNKAIVWVVGQDVKRFGIGHDKPIQVELTAQSAPLFQKQDIEHAQWLGRTVEFLERFAKGECGCADVLPDWKCGTCTAKELLGTLGGTKWDSRD